MFEQELQLLRMSHAALSAVAQGVAVDRIRAKLHRAVALIEDAQAEMEALDAKRAQFAEILREPARTEARSALVTPPPETP